MPKIEIDGVTVDAELGTTIIEVADSLSIPIPRFCYHKKLSVAANCRMCLVHVDKSAKALPACATPIVDGMKVWTKSKEAIAAQRAVMEFLLINHPLDCPVCDQGGECELQDVSMAYGPNESRYNEPKRAVLDHSIGPLIATEMTRCIHCTRCVRFGAEISGQRELGATGRGEFMEIGTFIQHNVDSEVSGNVIDLCPVGALTSKPFRFKARAWELQETAGISPHDCIGSNLYLHSLNQEIMRIVPKDAEHLNEVWLSDRDRFSYEGLLHQDRLHKPLLCKQGKWGTVSWLEALKYIVAAIQLIISSYGADKIGVLVSPSATNEEYYLLQKLMRSYGCNNIDHRLRQLDFADQDLAPIYPNLGIEFKDLSQQDAVLLIGSNIAKEQPLASIRLLSMQHNGGKICAINAVDYEFNFSLDAKAIVPASQLLHTLAAVTKQLLTLTDYKADLSSVAALNNILEDANISAHAKNITNTLMHGKNRHIIIGQIALMHPQASIIILLGNLIAQMIGGSCGQFSDGANAAGAWLMGCVPHRIPGGSAATSIGKNALEMLRAPLNCYILYAIDPEFDSLLGKQAIDTLKKADFVIAFSGYQSDSLLEIADVILPIAQFSEYMGHMININGEVQSLQAVAEPFGESRPAWKVLRVLGNLSGFDNFEFNTIEDVTEELQPHLKLETKLPKWQPQSKNALLQADLHSSATTELLRIAPISLYAIDNLVRRAPSLQATKDAHLEPLIEVNSNTAKNLNVTNDETVKIYANDNTIFLKIKINNKIADYTAIVYQANIHTLSLGAPYSFLEVSKC